MDKKELKMYVTPGQEIIDLELEAQLLAGSVDSNAEGIGEEEVDDDDFKLDD